MSELVMWSLVSKDKVIQNKNHGRKILTREFGRKVIRKSEKNENILILLKFFYIKKWHEILCTTKILGRQIGQNH